MSTPDAAYPDWKAPARDAEILIWPDAAALLTDTVENHSRLSRNLAVKIQNVPLALLRSSQRRSAGIDDQTLLLASGHQTELYHPGVWAKDALAFLAAAKLTGQALHLAVDIDQPKHLTLRWPGGEMPISDDQTLSSAQWSGLLLGPSDQYLARLKRESTAASSGWDFEPLLPEFFAALQQTTTEPRGLSGALMRAMQRLDESLGVTTHALLVSALLDSEPYLVLAHDLLARAEATVHHYNSVLAEYRAGHRVRSASRPMPDLAVAAGECEVPFWLDDLSGGTRKRATVSKDRAWVLVAEGGDRFVFESSADGFDAAKKLKIFLNRHHLRLSPRALTLTMFFRLLLCDQFVHGIGGARYDQATDAWMNRLYGLVPPKFCLTTATLYFPGTAGRQRPCLPCLAHEGHRLKHQVLGKEKLEMAARIAALPRSSAQRQIAFNQMHGRLAEAAIGNPILTDWQNRLDQAKAADVSDGEFFDRELFYGIQPPERLAMLLAKYQAQFTLPG